MPDMTDEELPEQVSDPSALAPPPEPPPTLPGRGAYLLTFAAIVAAGLFGGVIGWGITDLGCSGNCTVATTIGTIVGAVGAALGVGVIGVLVLRAMAEWKRQEARAAHGQDDEGDQPNSTSRRKPSA